MPRRKQTARVVKKTVGKTGKTLKSSGDAQKDASAAAAQVIKAFGIRKADRQAVADAVRDMDLAGRGEYSDFSKRFENLKVALGNAGFGKRKSLNFINEYLAVKRGLLIERTQRGIKKK